MRVTPLFLVISSFRAVLTLPYESAMEYFEVVSYAAPNKSPEVFASWWYRVTRASMIV